ncbi:MAG TPA: TMEM165/GDT1 family protein [Firmicutes bacterium]|nr:TMEM165/GDT1 family protein [Bacillota bacterium]
MTFWQTFCSTFLLVFLAELGDKTQLSVMLLAAQDRSALSVFLGAALALIIASLLAVLVGGALARCISPSYIQKGAGLVFVSVGLLLLLGKI